MTDAQRQPLAENQAQVLEEATATQSPVKIDSSLPPLPSRPATTRPTLRQRLLTDPRVRMFHRVNKWSGRSLAVFFGIFLGFAAGVIVSILIVLGILDIDTSWAKELIRFIKN